jgi:predicted nucleic-acid-binding protein
MKALDTNVLVRYLVADDKDMALRALSILKRAQAEEKFHLITTLVLLEMLWVLRSKYGLSRQDICEAIARLENLSGVRFENPALVRIFVQEARTTTLELADLLIALEAKDHGVDAVLTFDRKASRSPLFEAVP